MSILKHLGDKDCGPRCTKLGCFLTAEEQRQTFEKFWSKGSWIDQQIFLITRIIRVNPAERTTGHPYSRRQNTFKYYINPGIPCCKETFLTLFDVSNWELRVLQRVAAGDAVITGRDRDRGETTLNTTVQWISDHIEQFTSISEARTMYDSKIKYLHPSLSPSKLFDKFLCVLGSNSKLRHKRYTYYHILRTKNLPVGDPVFDHCYNCKNLRRAALLCCPDSQCDANDRETAVNNLHLILMLQRAHANHPRILRINHDHY